MKLIEKQEGRAGVYRRWHHAKFGGVEALTVWSTHGGADVIQIDTNERKHRRMEAAREESKRKKRRQSKSKAAAASRPPDKKRTA